jgi:hypothetical protein
MNKCNFCKYNKDYKIKDKRLIRIDCGFKVMGKDVDCEYFNPILAYKIANKVYKLFKKDEKR